MMNHMTQTNQLDGDDTMTQTGKRILIEDGSAGLRFGRETSHDCVSKMTRKYRFDYDTISQTGTRCQIDDDGVRPFVCL